MSPQGQFFRSLGFKFDRDSIASKMRNQTFTRPGRPVLLAHQPVGTPGDLRRETRELKKVVAEQALELRLLKKA